MVVSSRLLGVERTGWTQMLENSWSLLQLLHIMPHSATTSSWSTMFVSIVFPRRNGCLFTPTPNQLHGRSVSKSSFCVQQTKPNFWKALWVLLCQCGSHVVPCVFNKRHFEPNNAFFFSPGSWVGISKTTLYVESDTSLCVLMGASDSSCVQKQSNN